MEKPLNSRCRDLLEVQDISGMKTRHPLRCRVNFLHRTVRDFLKNNYHEELRTPAGSMFDARSSLCKTIIALSKTFVASSNLEGCIVEYLSVQSFEMTDEMLLYAKDFERTEGQSLMKLLDELDRVNTIRSNHPNTHWTNMRIVLMESAEIEENGGRNFLALAIQAGLRLYVCIFSDSSLMFLMAAK